MHLIRRHREAVHNSTCLQRCVICYVCQVDLYNKTPLIDSLCVLCPVREQDVGESEIRTQPRYEV
jgi:hypothetical protein